MQSNQTGETATRQQLERYSDPAGDDEEALATEEVFDILSNTRRRSVLYHLKCNGSTSDLRTLTQQIAAWENDVEPEQVSNQQRMRVYTALRQSHLPKMDRKGIIDFDPDRGTVELRDSAVTMDTYLRDVFDQGERWVYVFAGIGIVGLVLSLGSVLGVQPLVGVPGIYLGLVVSIAVLLAVGFKLGYKRYANGGNREFDYI